MTVLGSVHLVIDLVARSLVVVVLFIPSRSSALFRFVDLTTLCKSLLVKRALKRSYGAVLNATAVCVSSTCIESVFCDENSKRLPFSSTFFSFFRRKVAATVRSCDRHLKVIKKKQQTPWSSVLETRKDTIFDYESYTATLRVSVFLLGYSLRVWLLS